jgi:chemotaxis protein MotB
MAQKKKKKCPPEGAADWLLTYGDMTTLLLTFFVLLFTTATVDGEELRLILAAFPGLGVYQGGNTLEVGRLAELGNTVMSLPSTQRGRALDEARRAAASLFQPEINSNRVRVTVDERGLVISLAADAFFEPASAELNMEEARPVLDRVAGLLQSDELSDRIFRVEGHTDSIPTDPTGPWESNWELGFGRANSVFRVLSDFGVSEQQFQVMSHGDVRPLFSNETPEGRAYNRRVDIVVLSEGQL